MPGHIADRRRQPDMGRIDPAFAAPQGLHAATLIGRSVRFRGRKWLQDTVRQAARRSRRNALWAAIVFRVLTAMFRSGSGPELSPLASSVS
ncbi:hypothetical protein MHPYR_90055 [uncultured Mycobacterium sp.]|uniref:Transposase n=1 Tax=uncultured Mycobacterium sp. TaxID=171292 RepID=A0A1Y5PM15_9MYCO|nr:hypothetical protein MHPYR_90055 [uncultured Mycobacterium sp.]